MVSLSIFITGNCHSIVKRIPYQRFKSRKDFPGRKQEQRHTCLSYCKTFMACALMCKPINIKSVRALASYRAQSLDIPLYRSSAKRFFPKMQKTLPLDCDYTNIQIILKIQAQSTVYLYE